MSKARLELNSEGIQELLHSEEITSYMETIAHQIAESAGDGYEVDTYNAGQRNICSVYTATEEAKKDTLENNTLLIAAGSVGGGE